jgi:hypothetical protein
MAWSFLASFFAKVPWGSIAKHAPAMVTAATSLFDSATERTSRKRAITDLSGQVEQLRAAVEALEKSEVEQARLVKDMATQLRDLAAANQSLRTQLAATFVLALAGIAVGIGAVLWVVGQ